MIDEVLRRIDGDRDELVELTRALIRIPTVNPPGDAYVPCVELVGERLRRRGFAVHYLRAVGTPGDSDRYPRLNLVARHESARPGPTVHFNSHIDVVEAGRGWTVDPWGGLIEGGRVYGRGACDMKGGLAASIIAVEAVLAVGLPAGAVEISATVDEESGGFGGVAYLAGQGLFSPPRVDHVVIPEPLNVDRVCIGHRGVWWAEIETLGRIAHGSMPFLGDCAVRHMGALLRALETELLPRLASRQTAMPVVPDAARASTLNFNSLHGGQVEPAGDGLPSPCVADSCRLVIDRRFLMEERPAEVKAEITELLARLERDRPGFRWRLRDLMEVQPVLTRPEAPVPQAVARGIEAVLGRPPRFVCSPGTYDQKHIARIGHLHDCVAYGPGILDLAHQPDEYVGIEDMVNSAKVMALAALDLAGLHP